jgi:hypothetical protein
MPEPGAGRVELTALSAQPAQQQALNIPPAWG